MQPKTVAFTKDALDSLKPGTTRYFVPDKRTPALRLAVYPSGVKTFLLVRKVKGTTQKIKIGRFGLITISQAREKARKVNSEIELGGDPQRDKVDARAAISFKELYEIYRDQYAVKFTRRPIENEKMMAFYVYPRFGKKKAIDISSDDMRSLHAELGREKSHGTANRVVAIISAAYNFTIKEGHFKGINPCEKLKKFPTKSRDRFLNLDELGVFFSAVDDEPQIFRDYFKILLYTGARKTNALMMRWSDINFDIKLWRVPEHEAKNREVNMISISEQAMSILKARYAFNEFSKSPSDYVFPGTGTKGYLNDPKRSFGRIKKKMGVNDIRIHDLRRTLGSYMAISGVSLPTIGKALNHKSHVSTMIYARLSQDPVLTAVNQAVHIMSVQKVA